MAHFVAFSIGFQKNIPLQNPPGGEGGGVYGSSRSIKASTQNRKEVVTHIYAYDVWKQGGVICSFTHLVRGLFITDI